MPWMLQAALWSLGTGAFPIFLLCFVRRSNALRRPEATLLAGYLLITGGFGAISMIPLDEHPLTTLSSLHVHSGDWGMTLGCLLQQMGNWLLVLSSLPMLICGLIVAVQLAVTKGVAWGVLVAAAVGTAVPVGLSATGSSGSWGNALLSVSVLRHHLTSLVMGVGVVIFAYRHASLFEPADPACQRCGYNLTGNVSGRCPECGKAI